MVTAQQLAGLMPDTRELLSDEPQMESTQHYQQLALLVSHLEWHWREQADFFIGANLTVYYTLEQLRTRKFLGPDFFLVRGVDSRPRTSWAVWNEDGRYPDLIIELLSDSTAEVDRTEKKRLYQTMFRTPEYFWFSPVTEEFVGFRLINRWYEAIPADERGRRWSEVLRLYLGVVNGQLRYFEADGALVLGPEETALREREYAEAERQRAEQAQSQAEQERQRAEQAQSQTEQERQRAELAELQTEQAQSQAEQERYRAEQAQSQAEQERQRAEQAESQVEQTQLQLDQEHQRAERLAQRLRDLGVDLDG
jgi:Uma2 family endonuclease